MKTSPFSAALFAMLVCGTSALTPASAQPSPGDGQRFVSIVKNLERAPMNPTLRDDRAWAVQWLAEAPDIPVTVCRDPLGGVSEKSYARAAEVVVQYAIAMGAFIVENPDRKDDPVAQQLAGVESALGAYQAMSAAEGSPRSSALEKLLKIRSQGKLPDFVRQAYRHCSTQGAGEQIAIDTPPDSARWEKIWDEPKIAVMYVDRSSISGSNQFRSIATRTVYRAPLPEGHIAERIRVEEFDCARHMTRMRHVTIVTNDGRPPQTIEWGAGKSEWQTYATDSLGAKKNEIACSPANHAE